MGDPFNIILTAIDSAIYDVSDNSYIMDASRREDLLIAVAELRQQVKQLHTIKAASQEYMRYHRNIQDPYTYHNEKTIQARMRAWNNLEELLKESV